MSEKNEKLCPGCGQPLITLKGDVTVCRTEDFVQSQEMLPKAQGVAREEVIVIDGEQIINPFGHLDARVKTIFDRSHDVVFTQNKHIWYPEQRRDWNGA